MSKNKTIVTADPEKQEIFITREFDAPVDLVFTVSMDPKHIPQWWGPRKYKTEVVKMEPQEGGRWRFKNIDKDGHVYAFHGVFHTIQSPHLVINTFEYEGLPETGHVILETKTFQTLEGGRTRLTTQSVFQSVADRDGMLQSGMEDGLSISYDRLEELVSQM
jgi:uncharacterized protein YndB with AHSA1/START domain